MKCKKCNVVFRSSWFIQKGLYGKLKKANFTDEKIKEILPACPACVKKAIEQDAS